MSGASDHHALGQEKMRFEFVQASEKDKPYLLNLRKLTMTEHLEKSGQFLTDEEHEFRLSDAYECSHLIICENELVGTLKYREFEEKLEIMQLQIHPEFQGKGLGHKIMEQVLTESKLKFSELAVLKNNPALKFYQRLGFHITGEDEYEYFMRAKH